MFSGITEDIGFVRSSEKKDAMRVLQIETLLPLEEVSIGESISVNGACLTVTEKTQKLFSVEVSPETEEKTNLRRLTGGSRVNLERALRLSDRLNGHMVSGHVDMIIRRLGFDRIGEGAVVWFELPPSLRRFIVMKGSATLNGVSLTINEIEDDRFSVFLIPHTIRNTNLLDPETEIFNLEVDLVGKYLEQLVGPYLLTRELI